ncbi:DNA helicase HerA-like ATPase [Microbacterium ginsengiterrae]|uniref:DNA helicase HerA-like ATPase n=1 Tax=Microbacterium ginsengiterrae TaxID=546115 RepID=A0A7W9CA99_9MICO|nr:ATP-binding protein [Microbacterium ginsengiterrae]MBB5741890.1 DNA helicase HerA-like ATPase [Microbacterium ginsengiterrae]
MTALTVGEVLEAPGTPARLDARKFNRHTFWCGQSGSGKTYALGVVLEQLLLETELPILILDPNADFVRLREPRATAAPEDAARWSELDMRVFRSGDSEGEGLHTRYVDLSPAAKAAVLQIDPIADAEEYNALLHLEEEAFGHGAATAAQFDAASMVRALRASGDPVRTRLANRMENLQVLEWDLWSRGSSSVVDVIAERPRATVLDLGGFDHPAEPRVAALAVLEQLWARREERRPILIVIDEAHNLCSPEPATAVERALTAQLIQIAAEGRKFGLWLFLSTQRPTKIHPNVLSQCDNLGLMRVNAPRDLAELAAVFGFAPEESIRRAKDFTQGQALFAGGFVGDPTVVQMGERLSEEAGGDVRVPLRS